MQPRARGKPSHAAGGARRVPVAAEATRIAAPDSTCVATSSPPPSSPSAFRLDLTQRMLEQLPTALARTHPNLTELDCSSNNIEEIPVDLLSLVHLHTLHIRWNKLSSLPPGLSSLSSITDLDCSFNCLQLLPDEVTQLSSLRRLILHDNQLSTLPSQMHRLRALTALNCNYNRIEHLPPSLCRCENLTELSILGNPLVSPPAALAFEGAQAILDSLRPLDKAALGLTSPARQLVDTHAAESIVISPARRAAAVLSPSNNLSPTVAHRLSGGSLRNSGRNQMATTTSSAARTTSTSSVPTASSALFSSPFTAPLLATGVRVRDAVKTTSSGTGAGVRPIARPNDSGPPTTTTTSSHSRIRVSHQARPIGSGPSPLSRVATPSAVLAAASLAAASSSASAAATLTSQLYPSAHNSLPHQQRKWRSHRDEKTADATTRTHVGTDAMSTVSPSSPTPAAPLSAVNNSADVQRVRQMMIARGHLSSLAQLEDALESIQSSHPEESDLTLENDDEEDEADADADELFLAEMDGRFPWLQRPEDAPLSAAAVAHQKATLPAPPRPSQPPSFPLLTADERADIESTCSRAFICSITCELMQQPVVAVDGHTYEREAISRWLLKRDRSPMTGEVLASKLLTPNYALRAMILEFVEARIKARQKEATTSASTEPTTVGAPSAA